jgi:hypothetical protein
MCAVDKDRLCSFSNKIDIEELKSHLHSFAEICKGNKDGGAIAQLDMPSRFRWLSATRSTVVQTSKVHPGLCDDPLKTLEKLYNEQVL